MRVRVLVVACLASLYLQGARSYETGDGVDTTGLIELGDAEHAEAVQPPDAGDPYSGLAEKISRASDQYAKDVQDELQPYQFMMKANEAKLKKDAEASMEQMRTLVKAARPRTKKKPGELQVEAQALRSKQYLKMVMKMKDARAKSKQAMKDIVRAKYKDDELQAENKLVKAGFKNITIAGALREPGACGSTDFGGEPFPTCLETKLANNECGDSYPVISCIKARRGETNLCAISEKIQMNCCTVCTMSNHDLCIKERMIMAGLGATSTNLSAVTIAMLTQFDPECATTTQKDFADHDMSKSAPLSPGFDQMITNEYNAKFGGGSEEQGESQDSTGDETIDTIEAGDIDDNLVSNLATTDMGGDAVSETLLGMLPSEVEVQ